MDSVPVGAEVRLDGEFKRLTPLTLDVDTRASVTLTSWLSDGREREALPARRFDGASFAVSFVPAATFGSVVLFAESRMSNARHADEWLGYGLVAVVAAYGGAVGSGCVSLLDRPGRRNAVLVAPGAGYEIRS